MRVSEAKTTSKGVLTLSDIKGVDLSSSPVRVKSTRASYMKNMICKCGVNHKRNGFAQVAQFFDSEGVEQKINGIYPYESHKGEQFDIIVHAGTDLFFCYDDFSDPVSILDEGVTLADEKSHGFCAGEKFFLLSGCCLYCYDGFRLEKLFDNEKAYVPITSIGITDTVHGSLRQSFEGVNLFSTKRSNKLTGSRNGTLKVSSADESQSVFTLEGSTGTFILDGEIDLTKEVTIRAEVFIDGELNKNSSNESALPVIAFYNNEAKQKTNINVSTIFNFPAGTVSAKCISSFMDGTSKTEIDGFNEPSGYANSFAGNFECKIANVDGHGVVTFTPALPSPVLGEDNITVEYYTKKVEPKIKAACECSVNTYSKMLAVVTEDDIVYYSSPSEGYSYFPDNNYIKAINNVSSLIAGGNYLGVASKDELAIISFSIDSSGEKIVCVPSLVKKHRDVGCISACSQAYVEGDTLFLSCKGIYGASQDGVHMRSSNINKELTSYNNKALESAHALEHDGRYYLFIDGRVYIADARYKTYESDRLDVSYEYEWWRWENCPCRVAINFNGRLLIGREDGRIMAMSEGYSDTTYYKLDSSEVVTYGNSFDFNEEIEIGENDRVKIEGAKCSVVTLESVYLYKGKDELQITLDVGDLITLMQRGAMEPGKELVFRCDEKEFRFTVASYDLETGQIIGENHEGELFHQGITVYMDSLEEFSFEKNDEGKYHLYNAYGEKVSFIDFDSMTVTITKSVPVECEIHTALFNFATDMKKKTIHKIAFVPGASTSGKIKIGYETDKRSKLVGQAVGSELDFSSLNFDNFTFDSTVLKSFEKRVHERNVQFIKFRLLSLEDADFSIESLNVIYSTNSR